MNASALLSPSFADPRPAAPATAPATPRSAAADGKNEKVEKNDVAEKFTEVFGEILYGQMMKSLRESVPKNGYFHGGQAEEIFQQQLDQLLVQEMTKRSGHHLTAEMDAVFQQFRSY